MKTSSWEVYMQWIVGHRPEFHLVVSYKRYWSAVNSQKWDVESTLKLNYEEASIPMGPSGPCSKLIYLVGMGYEGLIDTRFTFVHKGVLVIA